MSSKLLFSIGLFVSGMSVVPLHANECGPLYFDAYGMYAIPCEKPYTDIRKSWTGMMSVVPKQGRWSALNAPRSPADEVDILTGQKTIRAGDQKIMTIARLVDRYGNPAPNGIKTDFFATIGQTALRGTYESQDGLAIWVMHAPTQSTTGYMSAATEQLQSKRSDFHVISAGVTKVEIAKPSITEFSAKSQIALTAINIHDAFDNDKDDGALVRFQSTAPSGSKSFAQGLISNHRATAFPFNDASAPSSIWTAHIGAGLSKPITLKTNMQQLKPDATITIEQDLTTSTMRVKAGPFKTEAGHRAIDGTPVQFAWRSTEMGDDKQFTAKGRMVDGWANTIMPLPAIKGTFMVEARLLGKQFGTIIDTGAAETTKPLSLQFYAELRGSIS